MSILHTRGSGTSLLTALLLVLWSVSLSAAEDLSDGGGLAIVTGDGAAAQAMELAQTGRWLVRAMASDEIKADQLRQDTEAMVGLISVRAESADGVLPFHTDTVNLVILGSGSAITAEEARRVLAPRVS